MTDFLRRALADFFARDDAGVFLNVNIIINIRYIFKTRKRRFRTVGSIAAVFLIYQIYCTVCSSAFKKVKMELCKFFNCKPDIVEPVI